MLTHFSRRAFVTSMFGFAATAGLANAPTTSLRPKLRPISVKIQGDVPIPTAIEQAKLGGKTGVAVVDLATGQVLESHGGSLALPPASVAKVITALYALDSLGSDYRFETRLVASGPLRDGVVQGDLILVGGGDPQLDTDDLNALATSLAAKGVKGITGRFLVYGGALAHVESIDGGQPPHVGYSPAVSGMCLNFNRVFFEWRNGADGLSFTMDARSQSLRPPVRSVQVTLAERAAPIYEYRKRASQEIWSVSRPALGGNGGRWLPVRDPETYTGEVFQWLAARQGITLPQAKVTGSKPNGTVLATHRSDPLIEITRRMLKYSTNLTAECLGLTATKARGKLAANLRASGREMERWAHARLGLKKAKFVDHSGLGDASRMSAEDMARALSHVISTSRLKPLLKLIELRDAKGRPYKTHPITVNAKTGTLNFVSGLAGYMRTEAGKELAFAVFSANEATRRSLKRSQRERPEGARGWNRRARQLQQVMIERWGRIYAS
jgi:D-alanyl-D-alanine carboxypeptidase/D-alanyl-D-alanine-endopeptidase (penicillin-binding protein 4)